MEYYSAIQKNESLSFAPTRINLEITKLSEANQTEKQIYDLTYIWDLKNGKNELKNLQNRIRLPDLENKLIVTKVERLGEG